MRLALEVIILRYYSKNSLNNLIIIPYYRGAGLVPPHEFNTNFQGIQFAPLYLEIHFYHK
jgi:hypothetical protein